MILQNQNINKTIEIIKNHLHPIANHIPLQGVNYTYIIHPKGKNFKKNIPYKIGKTSNPLQRIEAIKKVFKCDFNVYRIYVNGKGLSFEKYLHNIFKNKHLVGRYTILNMIGETYKNNPVGWKEFYLLDDNDLVDLPKIYRGYLINHPIELGEKIINVKAVKIIPKKEDYVELNKDYKNLVKNYNTLKINYDRLNLKMNKLKDFVKVIKNF